MDDETLKYLRGTGRDEELVDLVERYYKEQNLFRTDDTPEPRFSETLELELDTVEASLAGPRRPQDRISLADMNNSFQEVLAEMVGTNGSNGSNGSKGTAYDAADEESMEASDTPNPDVQDEEPPRKMGGSEIENPSEEADVVTVTLDGEEAYLKHGSAVIAAITSCTNTSNPSVMIGAGLLAKKAVEKGLTVDPHVKTSLAPARRW